MDNLKSAAEKLSKEIEELTKQRDTIMSKISDLTYKKDILLKAEQVLMETEMVDSVEPEIQERPFPRMKRGSPSPQAGKGMTASTLKLLSPVGKFMSILEVLRALEQEGYITKRVNVYIMLKRLVDAGKVICKKEKDEVNKYGLVEDDPAEKD